MTYKEVWNTDGVGLAQDADRRMYVLVEGNATNADALKIAASYFKCAKSMLKVQIAHVDGDEVKFPADVWKLTQNAWIAGRRRKA